LGASGRGGENNRGTGGGGEPRVKYFFPLRKSLTKIEWVANKGQSKNRKINRKEWRNNKSAIIRMR
jgi:hypothetical protein